MLPQAHIRQSHCQKRCGTAEGRRARWALRLLVVCRYRRLVASQRHPRVDLRRVRVEKRTARATLTIHRVLQRSKLGDALFTSLLRREIIILRRVCVCMMA